MRILLFFLFLFIFSCNTFSDSERVFICGDHPCANKREVKNYFDNNISIEVYTVTAKKKRDKDFDLVQLNMSKEEKDKYVSLVEKEKSIKKKLKNRKKIEKIDIENEKKVKKIAKRTESKKKRKKKRTPNLTLVRLCKNLEECDIDDVAKIILDMSKKKKFPDITE